MIRKKEEEPPGKRAGRQPKIDDLLFFMYAHKNPPMKIGGPGCLADSGNDCGKTILFLP